MNIYSLHKRCGEPLQLTKKSPGTYAHGGHLYEPNKTQFLFYANSETTTRCNGLLKYRF